MMLTANNLCQPSISHAFFTREGGVSEGIYAGLNCGPGSQDKPEYVEENRRRARTALKATALCTLYQIHSPDVVMVTSDFSGDLPKADAMVTRTAGIMLGILTADCAPVLLADVQAGVIGAAHAGWKGAVGGVLENTVAAMEKLGAARGNIVAAIGPCIHQASYETGEDFRKNLLQESKGNEEFFNARNYFNLPAYVANKLKLAGVEKLETLPHDTYADEARFFSFRRTTHRKEADYGRQLSGIVLR